MKDLQDSLFIEAVGEHLINCGNTGNYMQLYLQVAAHRISDIKYQCSCEPWPMSRLRCCVNYEGKNVG